MPDVGLPELLIILAIVLLLFGATRLPKLGRSLGQGISGFRRGLHEGESPDEEDKPDQRSALAPPAAEPAPEPESPDEEDKPDQRSALAPPTAEPALEPESRPGAESPSGAKWPSEAESSSEAESRFESHRSA
jgi:sec-independent protein translocase protein TatA